MAPQTTPFTPAPQADPGWAIFQAITFTAFIVILGKEIYDIGKQQRWWGGQ